MKITKRDGSLEIFDENKIYNAVKKAFNDIKEDGFERFSFTEEFNKDVVTIEEVQDAVIRRLQDQKFENVALAYADYRDKRKREREVVENLMRKAKDISVSSSKEVDLKRENANINGDGAMGQMLRFGSETAKAFYLSNVIDPRYANAHINGDIHIHDLDFYSMTTTCCQIDIKKLLEGGFNTGHGALREPNSITTAAALACIAIQSNQNDQHGGQSIPNFDYGLAPYVRKTLHTHYKEALIRELSEHSVFEELLDRANMSYREIVEAATKKINEEGYYDDLKYIEGDFERDSKKGTSVKFYQSVEKSKIVSFLPWIDTTKFDEIASCQRTAYFEAQKKTERDTYQAMEALVHNLNTMHCLKGSARIFVETEDSLYPASVEDVYNNFGKKTLYALSINKDTLGYEYKKITNVVKLSNRREMVRLISHYNEVVADVTTNHVIHDYKDGRIVDVLAKDADRVLTIDFEKLDDLSKKEVETYGGFQIIPVVKKEFYNSGEEYVYDITVEDNENFILENGTIVHNSRAGAQVPFSSINYGTDTSDEGRLVTKCVLKAHEAGLGDGETPIFPIHIFRIKEGVNYNESDPNYDLFDLACRVSEKRMFPNFSFQDAPFNFSYYKKDKPETEISYMGALSGSEVITYSILGEEKTAGIKELWDDVYSEDRVYKQGISEFIEEDDLDLIDLRVYDCMSNDFVKVKRVVKNNNLGNWARIHFYKKKPITVTDDHPFLLERKGRTMTYYIEKGDLIRCSDGIGSVAVEEVEWLNDFDECSYDVETESDRFDVSGVVSHNCRTRVIGNVYDDKKEIAYSRGNLSFTSINLPRVAIEFSSDVLNGEKINESNLDKFDTFIKVVESRVNFCCKQLRERFRLQSERYVYNFPFLMKQGCWLDSEKLKDTDKVGEVLKHGTLSVGFIGLAETLKVLFGVHHGESDLAQEAGLKLIGAMRAFLDGVSKAEGLNYTLLATPAEGLSGRFVRMDAKKYGVISGVTDKEYYTNSFHIPVEYKISINDKIKKEAPYHALTNAGHISYVELDGDASSNHEAFKKVVRAMKESGIGYGAINHPIDRDDECGYDGVIYGNVCPKCGREETEDKPFSRIRRITGYLVGTLDRFNNAKRAEEKARVKHN